jgi:hypothetical protein
MHPSDPASLPTNLPLCFIGDREDAYSDSHASLSQRFNVLYHAKVTDPMAAAALSSVLLLNPDYLGHEHFHALAGAGPTDRLLVISDSAEPLWSTNQITRPITPELLIGALEQTIEGHVESLLLDMPRLDDEPTAPPLAVRSPSPSLHPGDLVVSRSTPSFGVGTLISIGPVLAQVRFPQAPGKLAEKPIRCHISVLRRADENL